MELRHSAYLAMTLELADTSNLSSSPLLLHLAIDTNPSRQWRHYCCMETDASSACAFLASSNPREGSSAHGCLAPCVRMTLLACIYLHLIAAGR